MLKRIPRLQNSIRSALLSGAQKERKSAITWEGDVRYYTEKVLSKKWDLLSAVCLERHPVITAPMQDIEKKFQEMLWEIELEDSMKSDHELSMEKDKKMLELQKKELADVDVVASRTAQDFEDASLEEFKQFKLAPRNSESEKEVDSINRKLDKNLLLLVEQQVGNTAFWIPPQSIRRDGETMRQTADRTLKEFCGTELEVKFYGNAPIGFYKYHYPKAIQAKGGSCGAKVFYFLAKYIDGSVSPKVKHQWLDRREMYKILPPAVHNCVSQFLLPD